jgi:hypothetical protein
MDRFASYDLMVSVLPEEGHADAMAFEGPCASAATPCSNGPTSKKPKVETASDADLRVLDEQLNGLLAVG